MSEKKPKSRPSPRRAALRYTYVLVLQPGSAILYDRQGHAFPTNPDDLTSLKVRGSVLVLDLTGQTETTHFASPDMTTDELRQAIELTPGDYLPSSVDSQVVASSLLALDDQQRSAALIAYLPLEALGGLRDLLAAANLQLIGIVPALGVALQDAAPQGGSVLVELNAKQQVNLLTQDGQVVARTRIAARATPAQRTEQVLDSLSESEALLEGLHSNIGRVLILGQDDLASDTCQALTGSNAGVDVVYLDAAALARLAFRRVPELLLPVRQPARRSQPLLLIGLGLVAGLAPALVLGGLKAGTDAQITRQQMRLDAIQPQLDEYNRIQTRLKVIQGIEAQVATITLGRTDWRKSLQNVTDQLPAEGERYLVQLRSLNGVSSSPPPLAAATPPAPVGITTSESPPSTPPAVPAPALVTYTLTAQASDRNSINQAIANFEQRYIFGLNSLRQDQTGVWTFDATATEKP